MMFECIILSTRLIRTSVCVHACLYECRYMYAHTHPSFKPNDLSLHARMHVCTHYTHVCMCIPFPPFLLLHVNSMLSAALLSLFSESDIAGTL